MENFGDFSAEMSDQSRRWDYRLVVGVSWAMSVLDQRFSQGQGTAAEVIGRNELIRKSPTRHHIAFRLFPAFLPLLVHELVCGFRARKRVGIILMQNIG